jgi:hypothetical protein
MKKKKKWAKKKWPETKIRLAKDFKQGSVTLLFYCHFLDILAYLSNWT